MKRLINILFIALAISAVSLIMSGCDDDYDDVAPGSYVDLEHIETFPGDTVLISGQDLSENVN